MTLTLTASQLNHLADVPATIEAVEHALRDMSLRTARQPPPVSMLLGWSDSRFLLMGGLGSAQKLTAVKLLTDVPSNPEKGCQRCRDQISGPSGEFDAGNDRCWRPGSSPC